MNLKDEEWEPEPTDPQLLRKIRAIAKSTVSGHDLANLRAALLAPPFNGAIPHESRGSVWLLLLHLRTEDLLAEDPTSFARHARHAVADDNSREQIEKDVDRTRPNLARFKQPAVRGALLRLLSLFCERHNVAYVQGFNELLAPFILLADTGGNPRIAYALFSEFVAKFAPWMLETSESRVFDVLKRLFKYFARLLLYHDPELYWFLERNFMSPDLYATSWFVTLFARNFTVESIMALWDLLLLEDNPLGTTFFAIALLCSRRDELFSIDESRIPETLMLLTANCPADVRRLWKLGSEMRTKNTPPSFQRLMTDRLLHDAETPTRSALNAARAMQSSVCIQTTPDDLVAGDAHYFTWDCRTEHEYAAGHLAQAAYLPLTAVREANGEISADPDDPARKELQSAVDLCLPLRASSHICLVGSGVREEDDTDINVLGTFLTQIGIPYVSTLRGGFQGALDDMENDRALTAVELVDFNRRKFDHARRTRLSTQRLHAGLATNKHSAPSSMSLFKNAGSKRDSGPLAQSFLEKTDAEVTKALSKAFDSVPFKQQLSSTSSAYSGDREPWAAEATNTTTSPATRTSPSVPPDPLVSDSLSSPTSSTASEAATPSRVLRDGRKGPDRSADGTFMNAAGASSIAPVAITAGPTRRSSKPPASANSSRNAIGDSDGRSRSSVGPSYSLNASPGSAEVGTPRRNKWSESSSSLFEGRWNALASPKAKSKSPWGREARPGWLDLQTLKHPVAAMPPNFTVNVMDDRVMLGLRLFPCNSWVQHEELSSHKRSHANQRRYVGVSAHYFLLLSQQQSRSHVLEVDLMRHLQDIVRVTFKRSRPELVTFAIMRNGDLSVVERIECVMPDGLAECVELIRGHIAVDALANGDGEHLEGSSGGAGAQIGDSNAQERSFPSSQADTGRHNSANKLDIQSNKSLATVAARRSSNTFVKDDMDEFGELQMAPQTPRGTNNRRNSRRS